MPDSLPIAVKKLSDLSGVPWPQVQKVYRALQEGGDAWLPPMEAPAETGLPKSLGRSIWAAHPNFLVRMLVGLAAQSSQLSVRGAQERFLHAPEIGQDGWGPDLEAYLAWCLTNESAAADLITVEFCPDVDRTIVITAGGEKQFGWEDDETTGPLNSSSPMIRARGVISGDLFRKLQKSISWKLEGQSPMVRIAE